MKRKSQNDHRYISTLASICVHKNTSIIDRVAKVSAMATRIRADNVLLLEKMKKLTTKETITAVKCE